MENIKSPTERKMNGINKTLKKAEKTKYKVTGYKKVVYDEIEVIFEDDGSNIQDQAKRKLKEKAPNINHEREIILSLEVIK